MAIMRIHDVKRGPFFEHSSQLYNIATGVPNWGKVNSGLFKMYRVRDKNIPTGVPSQERGVLIKKTTYISNLQRLKSWESVLSFSTYHSEDC